MKLLERILATLGLLLTILPAVAHFMQLASRPVAINLMVAGMLAWFAAKAGEIAGRRGGL